MMPPPKRGGHGRGGGGKGRGRGGRGGGQQMQNCKFIYNMEILNRPFVVNL